MNIQAKIRRAIDMGNLNPEILGRRRWHHYIIESRELVWARNLWDGYDVHVYENDEGEIGRHLVTVLI